MDTPIKHLYSNAVDTYCATSVQEAFSLYLARPDADNDFEEIDDWSQDKDDETFYIHAAVGRDGKPLDFILPDSVVLDAVGGGENLYKATCGAWATVTPIGFFCSTEY